MASIEALSERDRAVLRSIFDPTVTIGDVADDGDNFAQEEAAPSTSEYKESTAHCAQGVALAEAGKFEEALGYLNRAINVTPKRAEVYNDRAQLLRLMQRDDGLAVWPQVQLMWPKMVDTLSQVERLALKRKCRYIPIDAMRDLDTAIDLTTGKRTRARALALCQRGVLLRKRGLDDEARVAYAEAAKLGSAFAKKQVVELNPYAALCNQMLSQVLRGDKDIVL